MSDDWQSTTHGTLTLSSGENGNNTMPDNVYCDLTRAATSIPSTAASHWQARDLRVIWHPCTQMKEHPDSLPLVPITHGEGAWLIGEDGQRYLDAVSSWWTNLFGHCQPQIAAAIAQQVHTLEHVMLAGFSHRPAVQLAEKLLQLAPRQSDTPPLAKVFFADNGSSAIEIALKMAFHFFHNRQEPNRTRFIALENGYHGETIGALSVSDVSLYRRVYGPLLNEVLLAPSPDAYASLPGENPADCARRAAERLGDLFDQHPGQICAVILEPLIQCAGGMRMYDPLYLQLAREQCTAHGALLIADEIATGFGRTGTLFACEQAGIMPDILCLSKGLTGGFLPLAAVLTTQTIYDAFLDCSRERAFLHSHSYTGNPIACAAACATLELFVQQPVLERNRLTAKHMQELAASFRDHRQVIDLRQTGMVLAFELGPHHNCHQGFRDPAQAGLVAYRAALQHGVILRPLGNVLYWMPPYCVTRADLAKLAEVTEHAISATAVCA